MAGLLDGLRVLDFTAGPWQPAGRILADLGASVVLVEPPGGDPGRTAQPAVESPTGPLGLAFAVWNAGKAAVAADHPGLADLLAGAHLVLASDPPGSAGCPHRPTDAPQAAWVCITAYGLTGPRAGWRGGDLTTVAAGGNMYPTGDPDRAPLRCTEPTSSAHTGPEAALAALTAVASGVPQLVDVSVQETFLVASMTGPARWPQDHDRGRRTGVYTGRTRETWACRDGWVSFGLRGGPARVRNLQTFTALATEAGVATPAVTDRDWAGYDHRTATAEELTGIEQVAAAFFARHSMAELYQMAVRTGLMLAPTNSPRELLASEQLAARGFFAPLGPLPAAPRTFVLAGPDPALVAPRGDPPATTGPPPRWPAPAGRYAPPRTGGRAAPPNPDPAWADVRIVEFGSGAAGPIATRYFAEHGATVVRVESRRRPDFLRSYTRRAGDPDASAFFSVLNAGKLSISLDLKHPDGLAVAARLVGWADVVSENFAPGAMDRFGLSRSALRKIKPDLIVASACLQGQTGPHRDYPGFGGQGAALSGYTFLTGWPDRAPVGPAGTITDSLAPRFVAVALAAALLHRRRTGQGVDLDLSQVEAAAWTLSPWLAEYAATGRVRGRAGNRHPVACPHGAFRCAGEDRWVALAVWTDDEWARLAGEMGLVAPGWASAADRRTAADAVERAVAAWTGGRRPTDVAERCQALGLDAYPVQDWADLHDDPQLAARGHFVPLTHPVLGEQCYEQSGFRLTATPGGVPRPGPTLGQHTRQVLVELLGLPAAEVDRLAGVGALD